MRGLVKTCAVSALAFVLSAALAGCSNESGPLTEADNASKINRGAGTDVIVELASNPSTGYTWVVSQPGPTEQVGKAEYIAPASGALGASGKQRFAFRTKGVGNSGDLRLEYRRPWEEDKPAEKTWTVQISVK